MVAQQIFDQKLSVRDTAVSYTHLDVYKRQLNKRVGFLNEVIEALELKNIEAVHGRAEDFARDKDCLLYTSYI